MDSIGASGVGLTRAITAWVMASPRRAMVFGALGALLFGAGAAWMHAKWAASPKEPLTITVADLERLGGDGQLVTVSDASWNCDRAIVPVKDAYIPIAESPQTVVVAFIGQQPCGELSATAVTGFVDTPEPKQIERLGLGGDGRRVVFIDMVDTPGVFLFGAIFLSLMALSGVYVFVSAFRARNG